MENREYIRQQFTLYLNGELTGSDAESLLQYIRSGQKRDFIESLIGDFPDHPIGRQLAEDVNVQYRLAQTHTRINELIDGQEKPKRIPLSTALVTTPRIIFGRICFDVLFHHQVVNEFLR